jgi:hypothetical protein
VFLIVFLKGTGAALGARARELAAVRLFCGFTAANGA